MHSLYTLKSSSEASKYYQKDNYYTKESNSDKPFSQWYGKGAAMLNLKGNVSTEQFKQLLEGKLPNGVEMLQKQHGGHHRPGYDLTFSAPKSVSILGIVGHDERIIDAHRKAVAKVLDDIEQKYAAVRTKRKSQITIEKTNNFTFAAFEHTDSRAIDPNLHTHCILMNFTQREDGQWRTIYGDPLYKDKLLNGMEYRVALAKELNTLGYEIVQTSAKGTFELAHFDEKIIKQFSKRREQIENKLEEMGQAGGKAAQVANFLTRDKKMKVEPDHILARWEHELNACGSNMTWLQKYSKEAKERGPIESIINQEKVTQIVDSAIEHLSEKKTHFTSKELWQTALGMSLISYEKDGLTKEIASRIENCQLISEQNGLLTTQLAREEEKKLTSLMLEGKNQVKPIYNQLSANIVARFRASKKNHREILKFVLTSSDRQIGLNFVNKEDFNQVTKDLNGICKNESYYPCLITTTTTQKEHFKNETDISHIYTISDILNRCENKIEKGRLIPSATKRYQARQLWIICPQTNIHVRDAVKLQQHAKHFGARIIWASDPSNRIISSLEKEGIAHFFLKSSNEQSSSLHDSLQKLVDQGQVSVNQRHNERIEAAVEKYMLSSNKSQVLAGTHANKITLNERIHQKLIQEGKLGLESIIINTLHPIHLSEEQKKHAHFYQLNELVYFVKKSKNFKSESYCNIEAIDYDKNHLVLKSQDGNTFQWNLNKKNTKQTKIYRAEPRELRAGERITWTKTYRDKDPSLIRKTGESATILFFEKEHTVLSLQNGKTLYLDRNDINQSHFDYGYAALLSQPNRAKTEHNIILLNSHEMAFLDQDNLQSLLDNSKQCYLVCDDIKEILNLKEKVKNEAPFSINALLSKKSELFPKLHEATEKVSVLLEKEKISNVASSLEDNLPLSPQKRAAFDAVDTACTQLIEKDAVINFEQAKLLAFQLGGLKSSKEEIEKGFEVALENGLLIKVGEGTFTTLGAVTMEKSCLGLMKKGQDALEPIIAHTHSLMRSVLNNAHLTQGQKDAILLSLTSSDRVIGIQGVAGAGKTTMLKEVNRHAQEAGFQLLGLANTASAKNRISDATQSLEKSGIASMTTRKFLNHAEKLLSKDPELAKSLYGNNRVLVLDEASLASTKDMFSLLSATERLGSRLLLIGDIKQLGAIEAGNPWALLLGSSMKSVAMTENVRFQDPHTVQIMRDLYAARIDDALDKISLNTVEIPDKEGLITAIANLYLGRTPEEQEKTLVISPKNEDRIAINNKIRTLLKDKGFLQGEEINSAVLLPIDKSDADKSSFYAYEIGQYIRFNYSDKRLSIQSGDYLEVTKAEPNSQLITLKNKDGHEILWSSRDIPGWSGAIEIFEKQHRNLMPGDKIRWKKNDEERGIYNGDIATLQKIEDKSAIFKLKNGQSLQINLEQTINQHWDHAYASTVFVAQGQDVQFTIGLCQGPKPFQKKIAELRAGDVVVLPHQLQSRDESLNDNPKIVMVNEIKDNKLKVIDKENKIHCVDLENRAAKEQIWDYYPPFEDIKNETLPKSTSLSGFLVQATRGDDFVMFVDNADYFNQTLKAHPGLKETAMQYLDLSWSKMAQKLEGLTANVTGKALKSRTNIYASGSVVNESSASRIIQDNDIPKFKSDFSSHKSFNFNKDELIKILNSDILKNVTLWKGKPFYVTLREARWGNRGSFSILLTGSKAGTWSDFEQGKHGRDLISLYMTIFGVTYKEALIKLAGENRIPSNQIEKETSIIKVHNKTKSYDDFEHRKIKFARTIYDKGIPIKGTLAEKYLREHRAIQAELPKDFRFCSSLSHPHTKKHLPALLAPIRDKNNSIIGVGRTFLNQDGSKYNEIIKNDIGKEIKIPNKANLGIVKGGAVIIQEGLMSKTLWVAEGIETALSVAQAKPHETVIASLSVSQLKDIPVPETVEKVVFCLDNDGNNAQSHDHIFKAAKHHISEGRQVFMAIPTGKEKCDFNDLLKKEGIESVSSILEKRTNVNNIGKIENLKTQRIHATTTSEFIK